MSFGGAVAAYHCVVDPRRAAALNLDGLQFGDMADASLQVPYMMVYSDQDYPSSTFGYRQARAPAYQLMIRGQSTGTSRTPRSRSRSSAGWADSERSRAGARSTS